jgi:NAD(P) transhydrogenase subunit alpha
LLLNGRRPDDAKPHAQVRVETGAGLAASFTDAAYEAAGASVVGAAADAWAADLVLKLNPPTAAEADLLGPGQVRLGA